MFGKLADVIVKRHKLIIIAWIAVLLASVPFMLKAGEVLKYDMTSMEFKDTPESVEGMEIIGSGFYVEEKDTMGTLIVVKYTDGWDPTPFIDDLKDKIQDRYGTKAEQVKLLQAGDTALLSVSYDRTISGSSEVSNIRGIISQVAATYPDVYRTYVTGQDAIGYDTEAAAMSDIKKIDPFTVLLILILIGLFFRSLVSAATPPMAIGLAYGVVMCFIYFLGSILDIHYITPILLLVCMLGAGCDYCIFIMARYREERKSGKDKEGALRESVEWAGESIATSGASVIIGFGVLSFCSFSVITTLGIVLAVGIVIALLAALTFIPSVLMLVGDRIFMPSTIGSYTEGSRTMEGWYGRWSRRGERYFRSSAKHAIKYAKPIALAAVLITIPMAYVTLTHETSYDMIGIMPDGEAKQGVEEIVGTMGGGIIMPTYAVVRFDQSMADIDTNAGTLTWNPAYTANYGASENMLNKIKGTDNVKTVVSVFDIRTMIDGIITLHNSLGPAAAEAFIDSMPEGQIKSAASSYYAGYLADPSSVPVLDYMLYYRGGFVSTDGSMAKITVIVKDEPMSGLSMETLKEIQGIVDAAENEKPQIVSAWVTGSAAVMYDISQIVNGEFRYIELAVMVLIFILLFFVMRSYLTPLRGLVTIMMSIVWTLGLTHLLFTDILGMEVIWIVPIVLFVICLGLGMDYDILLTTRIRENRLKGMSNDDAISNAVIRSGAVITICGLIMSGAFFTMMLSTSPMLMEFGFALGFAIMVDALVVRTYIVPAVMHLLGDWAWKGPSWLHRGKHRMSFEDE